MLVLDSTSILMKSSVWMNVWWNNFSRKCFGVTLQIYISWYVCTHARMKWYIDWWCKFTIMFTIFITVYYYVIIVLSKVVLLAKKHKSLYIKLMKVEQSAIFDYKTSKAALKSIKQQVSFPIKTSSLCWFWITHRSWWNRNICDALLIWNKRITVEGSTWLVDFYK